MNIEREESVKKDKRKQNSGVEIEDLKEVVVESEPVRCLMVISRWLNIWVWNSNDNMRPEK